MSKQTKWGLFVGIGIILLFLVFFLFGEIKFFKKGYNIYIKYNFTAGLTEDAPVRLAGYDIGNVEKIKMIYEKDSTVYILVKVWIKEDIRLRNDSNFYINTLGLLGEKYIEITPGTPQTEYIPKNATVIGNDPLSTEQMMSKGKDLAEDIEEILKTLRKLMSRDTFDVFINSFRNLNKVMLETEKILKENRENIYSSTTNLNNSLKKLSEISKNLETVSEVFKNSFEGKAPKFEKTIKNIDMIAENLKILSEKINKGDGSAGKFVNEKEVYENLNEATKELNELIKDIKDNPKKYFKFSVF